MNIEEFSEPQNLQIHCKNCKKLMPVEFKDLRENNPLVCLRCNHSFTPNIDVDALLRLMKQTEDSMLGSDLIM